MHTVIIIVWEKKYQGSYWSCGAPAELDSLAFYSPTGNVKWCFCFSAVKCMTALHLPRAPWRLYLFLISKLILEYTWQG